MMLLKTGHVPKRWHCGHGDVSRLFGYEQQTRNLVKKRICWKDVEEQEYWKIRFQAGKGLRALQEFVEQELAFGLIRVVLQE